jgi:biotin carboxylase
MMMKHKKRILIIGATWEQEPLLKKAKDMNLYVIATNFYPDAEGFKYADQCYVVDPRNLSELDELFNTTLPDAVIADECDYSMFAVAFLTNKYGLPGPRIDSLLVTNNKYLQRKCGYTIGMPQPEFKLCMTFKEVEEAANEITFPIILKPLDNRGSIGVCRVENEKSLRKYYFEAMANSHSRQILVEKLIPGQVVTLDGVYAGKFHNTVFSTKKMHPKFPDNAMHLQFPGNLPQSVVKKIFTYNLRLIEDIGINYGLTHTEFIIDGEDVFFLEIANRGGGVHISNKIVPEITGIDICDVLIRSSLGEKVFIENYDPFYSKAYSFLHFFDFGEGRVVEILNVDKLNEIKGVLSVRLNIKAGDYLGDIKTAVNRPGFVIVAAKSINECSLVLESVYDTLKVRLS